MKELNKSKKTSNYTEILGGFTTFITMSYIIFVNAQILSQAGMDKAELVSVTALSCFLCTLLSAFITKSPICFAPGMGLNSLFVASLVISAGFSAPQALGLVFWASLLFLVLSILGVCEKILNSIPNALKSAISIGIGLFIARIGIESIGLFELFQSNLFIPAICGVSGLLAIFILEKTKIKGSILLGIILASILSIILGYNEMPSTYFSTPPSIKNTFLKLEVFPLLHIKNLSLITSLLIIEILGITGTIISCKTASQNKLKLNSKKVFIVDAVSGIIGSVLGTSTMTGYIESATGIKEGARRGLSAFFCACLFLIFLFLSPIIKIVPSFATAPALIAVGFIMAKEFKNIDIKKYNQSIPAFLTIVSMPLFMDIGIGMTVGFISYIIINLAKFNIKNISPILIIISLLSLFNLTMLNF